MSTAATSGRSYGHSDNANPSITLFVVNTPSSDEALTNYGFCNPSQLPFFDRSFALVKSPSGFSTVLTVKYPSFLLVGVSLLFLDDAAMFWFREICDHVRVVQGKKKMLDSVFVILGVSTLREPC
jgi:hypothetical protein